jgi:hypothetical protein
VQVLLELTVLLRHLLVLGLPLVAFRLQCLHLALVVAGLDVGLAEPVGWKVSWLWCKAARDRGKDDAWAYFSFVSRRVLSFSSASSSRSCTRR